MRVSVFALATAVVLFPTGAPGNDIILDQGFEFGALITGLACGSGQTAMVSDDFSHPEEALLEQIGIWVIYTGAPSDSYNLEVRNNGSEPGPEVLWSATGDNVANTDTGFAWTGYSIYHVEITLEDTQFFSIAPDTEYWLCAQAVNGSPVFSLSRINLVGSMSHVSMDNGATWVSSQQETGQQLDQFIMLYGSIGPQYFETNTWAGVKALFD